MLNWIKNLKVVEHTFCNFLSLLESIFKEICFTINWANMFVIVVKSINLRYFDFVVILLLQN